MKIKTVKKKISLGQMKLPWDDWEIPNAIHEVAEKFVLANCFNFQVASAQFARCQVSDP